MYIDGQYIRGYVSDNLSVNFILHGSAFAWLGVFCSKSSCFLYFFKKQVGKTISYLKNVCNNIFLCKNSCYVIHRTVIRMFVSVQSCIRGHLKMIFEEVGRDVRMDFALYFHQTHAWTRFIEIQKQPFRGVHSKRCSDNMQQNYRRTPMPKCDFNKVALQLYWNHTWAWVFPGKFAAYLQNIFTKNTSGWLLLKIVLR